MHRCVLPGLLLPIVLVVTGAAANPQAKDVSAPDRLVVKAEARTVTVDVVVTDKKGAPIIGRSKEDFLVQEDGHDQVITSFTEHMGAPPRHAASRVSASTVSTTPSPIAPGSSSAVTVLLLDSLNTPLEDQGRVHQQMLKYLENLQSRNHLAIFSLGSRLRMIQSFTDDPAALKLALDHAKRGAGPQSSPILESKTTSTAEQRSLDGIGGSAGLQEFLRHEVAYRDDARLLMTLQAFYQLSRYLAPIPGRKNVIWFSSAFPIVLFSNSDSDASIDSQRDHLDLIRDADAAMAAAEIAVYPVAADGLVGDSLYDAASQMSVHTAFDAQTAANKSLRTESVRRNADHATMDQIAADTGGEAIYNSNDLNGALARVMDRGSYYYTLYYTPTNKANNGQIRKIKVRLADRSYKLAYRRGYYAKKAQSADH